MKTYILLLLVAVALGVGRFYIPTHGLSPAGSYEALAHLFIGGLIGAWLVSRNRFCLALVVILSALELTAFLTKV